MLIILIFISAIIVAVLDGIMEYVVIVLKRKEESIIWSIIDWFITAILFYFILKSENFVIYLTAGSIGFGLGNFLVVKIISKWNKIKRKIKKIFQKIFASIVGIITGNVLLRQHKKIKK